MEYVENVRCPIAWFCKTLKKNVAVSKFGKGDLNRAVPVYDLDSGWICDCGSWVKGNDDFHTIRKYGLRTGWKK